jgi:hypothetical protein
MTVVSIPKNLLATPAKAAAAMLDVPPIEPPAKVSLAGCSDFPEGDGALGVQAATIRVNPARIVSPKITRFLLCFVIQNLLFPDF